MSENRIIASGRSQTRPPHRAVAAIASVLAGAAALGIGQLVAGFVAPESAPLLAVGNTAINLTPGPVKEFAVRTFGTADKTVLLTGMAVVILLLAVLGGLLSRHTPRPGLVVIGLAGVLGIGAVLARPGVSVTWLLAPVAAALAGLGAFAWLYYRARQMAEESADDDSTGASRRQFLRSAIVVVVAASVGTVGGQLLNQRRNAAASREAVSRLLPLVPSTPIPPGADFAADGTPAFLTANSDFYRIDTALSPPQLDASQWQLRVHGMVRREITLTYADLLRYPLVTKPITLTCVSNDVGGSLISTATFTGVPIRDVLLAAGVAPGAQQVISTSSDGFTAGTPLDVLLDPNRAALLAVGMNGQPLPVEHGFPVRMVTPGLYGYVSATKWLVDLELTTFAQTGYWVRQGWSQFGPIKTESRIDRPRDQSQLHAGPTTAAGIAWAQHTGIDHVEVRVDGGPWLPAELSTEVSMDTWRMWRIVLNLPPGPHTLECRATDTSGYTQTSVQAPPEPNGATGWPAVSVTVQ